jgi:hypothetical protein
MTAAQVAQLVHQTLPQGLASLKAVVDINNVAASAYATRSGVGQRDQEIGISQQNADTNQFNADTGRVNAETNQYGTSQGLDYEQQLTKEQVRAEAMSQRPHVMEMGTTVVDGLGIERNGIPVGEKRTVHTRVVLDKTTGEYREIRQLEDGTVLPQQGGEEGKPTPEQWAKMSKEERLKVLEKMGQVRLKSGVNSSPTVAPNIAPNLGSRR